VQIKNTFIDLHLVSLCHGKSRCSSGFVHSVYKLYTNTHVHYKICSIKDFSNKSTCCLRVSLNHLTQ
jgi:hypothetical protein